MTITYTFFFFSSIAGFEVAVVKITELCPKVFFFFKLTLALSSPQPAKLLQGRRAIEKKAITAKYWSLARYTLAAILHKAVKRKSEIRGGSCNASGGWQLS